MLVTMPLMAADAPSAAVPRTCRARGRSTQNAQSIGQGTHTRCEVPRFGRLSRTWTVSVELDAGGNAAAAQSAADRITAMAPAELATVLGLNTVSFGFQLAAGSYDPATSPAAFAAAW